MPGLNILGSCADAVPASVSFSTITFNWEGDFPCCPAGGTNSVSDSISLTKEQMPWADEQPEGTFSVFKIGCCAKCLFLRGSGPFGAAQAESTRQQANACAPVPPTFTVSTSIVAEILDIDGECKFHIVCGATAVAAVTFEFDISMAGGSDSETVTIVNTPCPNYTITGTATVS